MRKDETETEISRRMTQLSEHITQHLDAFEQEQKFTRPSSYLHQRGQYVELVGLGKISFLRPESFQ